MAVEISYIKPFSIIQTKITAYNEPDRYGYVAEMDVSYRTTCMGNLSGLQVPTTRKETFYIREDNFDLFDLNDKVVGKFGVIA